ncbi:PadR family transcriptional regulator [Nocardiopsis sp. MG754419]|uniref:PadR family transcriptional regulator n=1 Tax=Nocardiopsis sp. MG754419 TaxID=2259865 RepID=UPI001BA615A9|nr:PadR family transcriptional regulator [Nocardiopsis sp. MG754419]MBR8742076.1 PadR family transcriptional regulator [Nocardiopsis sp. MG754419]
MSAIRLLVLGSVRAHERAHGYQVRSDLESWGAHEWSTAKPGSVYHALKQMARQGLLAADEVAPSDAGGPPRTAYALTERGEAEYTDLLRAALAADHDARVDVVSAGLGLMTDLPRAEVLELLRRRAGHLEGWRASVVVHHDPHAPDHEEAGAVGEVLGFWVHSAESMTAWTRALIARIEGGAHVFAGEGSWRPAGLPDGEEAAAT